MRVMQWMQLNFLSLLVGILIAGTAMPSVGAGCSKDASLKGVNIAGAEFNADQVPGVLFKNYIYPSSAEIDYFASLGANVIRLPVLWERIQPSLSGALAPAEIQNITSTIAMAKSHGMCVILDVHNYGTYRGKAVGTPEVPVKAFINLWTRLAEKFPDTSAVAFDLMNEPVHLSIDQWAQVAQQTVTAIRKQGASNVILVAGGRWSGVHDWFSSAGGVSNAQAFAAFHDPLRRTIIEVHQYADADYSGTGKQCIAAANFDDIFNKITQWAKTNGQQLFLGEFGVPANQVCLEVLNTLLSHMRNKDVWRGWTYWAAGQWWGGYPLSIEPNNGVDMPQTAVLKKFLSK